MVYMTSDKYTIYTIGKRFIFKGWGALWRIEGRREDGIWVVLDGYGDRDGGCGHLVKWEDVVKFIELMPVKKDKTDK